MGRDNKRTYESLFSFSEKNWALEFGVWTGWYCWLLALGTQRLVICAKPKVCLLVGGPYHVENRNVLCVSMTFAYAVCSLKLKNNVGWLHGTAG